MRKGSILCVDDEEAVLEMEAEMLQGLGYKVIASGDPAEAAEIFKHQADNISLVIADIVMPRITGNTLAKEVHFISPGTPVILVSGHTKIIGTDLTEEAAEIGVKYILEKPFTRVELEEAITKALQEEGPNARSTA